MRTRTYTHTHLIFGEVVVKHLPSHVCIYDIARGWWATFQIAVTFGGRSKHGHTPRPLLLGLPPLICQLPGHPSSILGHHWGILPQFSSHTTVVDSCSWRVMVFTTPCAWNPSRNTSCHWFLASDMRGAACGGGCVCQRSWRTEREPESSLFHLGSSAKWLWAFINLGEAKLRKKQLMEVCNQYRGNLEQQFIRKDQKVPEKQKVAS